MSAAGAPQFKARMFERIDRTPSVASFRFNPVAPVQFKAGQFVKVLFDETNRQNKELNKYLSFSSAPTHGYFELTKRLSDSAFSNRLRKLMPGDEVLFQGPSGNCVLPDKPAKIGFLIGGIGITPVIAMLEDIVQNHRPVEAILMYSNRVREEIAFKPELDLWQSRHKNIRVIYTLTDCPDKAAQCVYGRIDAGLMRERIPDAGDRQFYIFGPPGMVNAMEQLCQQAGCQKENIKAERFSGYD